MLPGFHQMLAPDYVPLPTEVVPLDHVATSNRRALPGSRHLMSDITDDQFLFSLLHSSTTPGIDGITYRHLWEIPALGLTCIKTIFNVVLLWERFHHSGNYGSSFPLRRQRKLDVSLETFRLITLMSTLEKTFEQILKLRLEWWLEVNCLLRPDQFRFRKGWSMVDTVATLLSRVKKPFARKSILFSIFLDMSSAFDSVLLPNLLDEFKLLRLPGPLVYLIHNLNSSHISHVKVGNQFFTGRISLTYADDVILYYEDADLLTGQDVFNQSLESLQL
ncbi:hypothetical protein PR048_016223 [Dryococelus australis]|uniref:Reverse transcriptase domain-containing protein n=1 Tax=Dryococelus australis TaxID=614101 RepID=A0ABQ9HJ51_9NEOP|nr:hypothetical protein PR048_016223 [Dryococelus australis]